MTTRTNPDKSQDFSDFVKLSGEKLDELLRLKQKPIDAVPTPLPTWNHKCRDFGGGIGLARGWHITIGANTGNGKSVFALNMAHEGVEHGENIGFVSLEMFWTQLATRYLAIVSGERIDALEPGRLLDAKVHKRAQKAVDELEERTGGGLWTNERAISSLSDIVTAIEFLNEVRGCRTIIVDYMQLAKVIGVSSLLEGVTQISGEVRGVGSDLRLVTIGLSQLNRETSKDYENPPTPQGLMGGSPLENDSDQVLLINHTKYERNAMANTAKQEFILGKNRHGPAGPINCQWDYSNLRIREVAPIYNSPLINAAVEKINDTLRQNHEGSEDRGEAWESPEAA